MISQPVTDAELQAYVDDRLAPDRLQAVTAWLTERPEEAQRLKAYRTQRDALRASLAPILDEPLPPALDLRLRQRGERIGGGWRRAAVAACAAGLVLTGGAGGWALRGWNSPPLVGTAALAREGAASYSVYANDSARPVEIAATGRQALDGWISERLARPVRAPDLRSAGLMLVGGRLIATEHGPAGFYLYRDTVGARIAVYVRPMKVDGTDRMTRRDEYGINGWTWADRGLGFGVFGTAPDDRLHGTANMVRAQYEES